MIPIPAKYDGRVAGSPQELADMIGVDRSTFYRRYMPHVYSGRIASLKVGSARRILITSFLAFIESEAQHGA